MLSSIVSYFTTLSPLTLWCAFIRIYGLMFTFALAMLIPQIRTLAGREGLYPIEGKLRRLKADYPSLLQRFLRYPSLHYIPGFSSDAALVNILIAASTVGFVCTVLGVWSRFGFIVMWCTYLSYASLFGLIYPWDYLLMESGFLAWFLPSIPSVFASQMSELPLPLVAFSFRFLLFRLMFGFGKFKFIGASLKEFSYLRGFMINQPMPTVFGWAIYQMPLFVHHVALAIFFISEIIAPWFYFSSGTWRIIAGLTNIHLMLAIQLTGNFGFFNVLAGILSLTVLDGNDAVLRGGESVVGMMFGHGLLITAQNLFLSILLLLALIYLPFNSWCTMSFPLWPAFNDANSGGISSISTILRKIAPFHIVHAYGIFFPHSSPEIRFIPVVEGTEDVQVNQMVEKEKNGLSGGASSSTTTSSTTNTLAWHPYTYRFMTDSPLKRPAFCAPFHARFDQAIIYESFSLTADTYKTTLSSGDYLNHNPLEGGTLMARVAAGLMKGNEGVVQMFEHTPFPVKKLQALRISFYLYQPTTITELWKSGRWYHRKYVGCHLPVVTRRMLGLEKAASPSSTSSQPYSRSLSIQYRLREPELAHPEHYYTILEIPAVRELNRRVDETVNRGDRKKRGLKSEEFLTVAANTSTTTSSSSSSSTSDPYLILPISTSEITSFWNDFIGGRNMRSLYTQLALPSAEVEKAKTQNKGKPQVPRFDWLFHLEEGEWSRIITQALRSSSASPFNSLTDLQISQHEKLVYRCSLALLHRLLPFYHGPAPEEMISADMIREDMEAMREGRGKEVKSGVFSLRPSSRDTSCTDPEKLYFASFFHLVLFTHHIILQGKDVYEDVMLRPETASSYIPSYSVQSSLLFLSLFHSSLFSYHAAKVRLIALMSFEYQLQMGGILPGFLWIFFLHLRREYRTEEEGALSKEEVSLPKVTRPTKWDQYWIVDHDGMKREDAPGLVVEERKEGEKKNGNAAAATSNKKKSN